MQTKKILIVSDIKRANSLIRSYESKTGKPMRNVDCRTLQQIAVDVYMWIQSEAGFTSPHKFIDQDEAQMLFRAVLIANCTSLPYFNNENLMNIATTAEVFRMVNLIRGNGWTDTEPSESARARISALKMLISTYEGALADKNKMDTTALYQFLLSKMEGNTELSEDLSLLFGADLYYLKEDTETYTGLQSRLLAALGCDEQNSVSVFPKETLAMEDLKDHPSMTNADFFKGYGSFNEANYVANDILKNKHPYGSVTVLYSSSSQLAAISSALQGNGIPMRLLSSHPVTDNPYVALARRILAWARDDYSEKALNDVLTSSVLYFEGPKNKEGKPSNLLGWTYYFSFVLDARNRFGDNDDDDEFDWKSGKIELGWGYERNLEFAKNELVSLKDSINDIQNDSKLSVEDKEKRLYILQVKEAGLTLLSEMIEIFGDAGHPYSDSNLVCPSVLYEKLVSFLDRYVRKRTTDYPLGMGTIKNLIPLIEYDTRSLSLSDCIDFIDSLLLSSASTESEDSMAVNVASFSDWKLLERPHLYVIGLSLKDMQGSIIESPVLLDEEMNLYLDAEYKPTVIEEKNRRDRNLYRTLLGFEGDSLSFGYSDYDTESFFETNPSSFFREALTTFSGKDINSISEFVYGDPDSGYSFTKNEYEAKTSDTIRDEIQKRISSSSRLERFLTCPKMFAYENIAYIPDGTFIEKNYSEWLSALERGSFFHAIMKTYIDEKCIRPRTEPIDSAVDDALLDQIIDNYITKLQKRVPYTFPEQIAQDRQSIRDISYRYLQNLLEEYVYDANHWHALATEAGFKDFTYEVTGYDRQSWTFNIRHGSIDRIDYRLNKQAKTIYLRIADYKTGKIKYKKEAKDMGELIQFLIYTKALMGKGKSTTDDGKLLFDELKERISDLEGNEDIQTWNCEFDYFQYDFPDAPSEDNNIQIKESEMESVNLTRLRALLTIANKKQIYPDYKDLCDFLDELASDSNLSLEESAALHGLKGLTSKTEKDKSVPKQSCSFCNYEFLCEKRRIGEVKAYES